MIEKKIGKFLKENQEEYRRKGLQLHDDHKAPMSRRDLLAAGFYSSAFTVAMPSALTLLSGANTALGQDMQCNLSKNIYGVPVIQIHRNGGARLWGDGLAIGLGGHGNSANYNDPTGASNETDFFNFGLAPDNHPSRRPYKSLGGHAMPEISYIYQSAFDYFGLAGITALEKRMSIMSLCVRTNDDNGATKQSLLPAAIMSRGNADFRLVSNGSGTDLNGLSAIPMFSTIERATVVQDKDISRLMKMGVDSFNNLDVSIKQNFIKTLQDLGASRITNTDAQKLLGCSSQAAQAKLAEYAQELDPLAIDPILPGVFTDAVNGGGNQNADANLAAISYMLKNGIALTAGLSFGGYDYHDGTSSGYIRDRNLFQTVVWRIVDYFYKSNSPVILYLTSDGATYSNNAVDPQDINVNGALENVNLATNTGDRGRNGGGMFIFLAGSDINQADFIKSNNSGDPVFSLQTQVGHGLAKGSVARSGSPIAYDETNYGAAAIEIMRRGMQHMSGKPALASTFQQAADGLRFNDDLETYIPFVKAGEG